VATVTVTLNDTNLWTTYNFKVLSLKLEDQSVRLNSEGQYTIHLSALSSSKFRVSVTSPTAGQFLQMKDTSSYTVLMHPTQNSEIGRHTINVKIEDPTLAFVNGQFKINVTNSPPRFLSGKPRD
jgi:hypothetical protein